jgi:hypothetical protein
MKAPFTFIITTVLIVLATVSAFFAGSWYGHLDARVRTGSAAFFAIHSIDERLQRNDPRLAEDIAMLLERMDPKNASDVNAGALGRFTVGGMESTPAGR